MSLLDDYMNSIDPLHAKAIREVASARGVLFVMTELVPNEVRDEMIQTIAEANPKNEDSSSNSQ